MRRTASIFMLSWYLYVCLVGLQLALAHEAKGRAGENDKEEGMSKVSADGMGPAVGQDKGNRQEKAQEADKQIIDIAKAQVMDSRYGRGAGPTIDKADKKAMTGATNQAMELEYGQRMVQSQVKANAKNAAMGQKDIHGAEPNMNLTVANAKNQAVDQRNQTVASVQNQAVGQSKNQSITNAPSKANSACQPQAKPSTDDQAMAKPKAQATSESYSQDANQGKGSGNIAQSQMDDQGIGQAVGQEQVATISGAQALDQIVSEAEAVAQSLAGGSSSEAQVAAAAPPQNTTIGNQQTTNGQSGRQSTSVHNANDAAASNTIRRHLALFSGVASAISGVAAVGTATSSIMPAAPSIGSSGPGICDNCQCNCPVAAFAMVQQAAMMAPTAPAAAAAPPRSTLQSSFAPKGDAQVTSASAQQPAPPMTTAASTEMNVAQAQAAQPPKVASPQAQGGATAGGAAAAVPTNLNTFSFQSAVTVPLGKRREARATAAFR